VTKPQINDLDKYKVIGNFLRKFPNYKTKHGYKSSLKQFFDFIDKNPDEYIRTDFRTLKNEEKIKVQDLYESDITTFWSNMISRNVPPKTINYYIATIRVLLQHYRITIDDVFWKDLRRRGNGSHAVTIDKPITTEILENILNHAELKARALFLMTASSGMRIGEVLQLKPNDIDLESTPTKITVRAETTKNKTTRITFISDEATRFLKEWLKERDEYLETASKRTKIVAYHGIITKSTDDPRIFPFSVDTTRDIWIRLITKAGYTEKDERTGWYKIHIHGLRKFFRSYFSRSESPNSRDIAEVLMGHNGYLNAEYLRFTEDQLKEEYQKAVKHLLIFDRPMSDAEQQKVISKMQGEIETLQKMVIDFGIEKSEEVEALVEFRKGEHCQTITKKDGSTFELCQ